MKRLLLVLTLTVASAAAVPAEEPSERTRAAMKELWRRGFCLLSSVHRPAERQAAVPEDIDSALVLQPAVRTGKGRLLCHAVDGDTLWAADDAMLYAVSAAHGRVVSTYGRARGLPEAAVQSIAPDRDRVWLATRAGLAVLNLEVGRIEPVEEVRFTLGRVVAAEGHAWIVSDAGAWHFAPESHRWQALSEFPAQHALQRIAAKDWWHAFWRRKLDTLIPPALCTDDGLYCICSKRLLHFDLQAGQWRTLSTNVWHAAARHGTVWALGTTGVLRYEGADGSLTTYALGEGPAAGRPIDMALADDAFYLVSEPDYDEKSGEFIGGGISRFDLEKDRWTVTERADGVDIRFLSTIAAHGDEVWAACLTYDRPVELGAHPGMAHVKRWKPRATGLALVHRTADGWVLIDAHELPSEKRWVMGQKDTVNQDEIVPRTVEALCLSPDRIWGVYRMMPRRYYAGYYFSFGCLARREDGGWKARFDARTRELHLQGEQPDLMLISHSHGQRIVLAEGHPDLLGAGGADAPAAADGFLLPEKKQ